MKSMSMPLGGIINLLKIQVGLIPKPGEESEETKSGEDSLNVGGGSGEQNLAAFASILEGSSGQNAADAFQVMLNRTADAKKGGSMKVYGTTLADQVTGQAQFSPISAVIYDGSTGDSAADSAYGQLRSKLGKNSNERKIKLLEISSQGTKELENFFKKGSAAESDKILQDFKSGGKLSQAAVAGVRGRLFFKGQSNLHNMKAGDFYRGTGGNYFHGESGVIGTLSSVSPNSTIPSGDPGNVKSAGATAGGNISGYPVTSVFGMRYSPITGKYQKHGGVDISAPPGKPIGLTVDAIAGPPPQYEGGYGNFMDIIIPSLGNLYFRMAHFIKPPNYKPGEKIPAGKIIANVGSTGESTGPHIHFEVNKSLSGYGGDRDPMPYGKYLTIGRESGGPTLHGGIRKLHKGEYVIDKDSVDLFGGTPFFSMINGVENEKQRSEKSSQLIQHLSKYTGREIDKIPDLIYASDPIIIQGPPTYIASGSSRGSSGGGSSNDNDNTFDRLERMT